MKLIVLLGRAKMTVDMHRFNFGDGRWAVKANRAARRMFG